MTARPRHTSSDTLSLNCHMPAEWERHIAYDIGAAGLSERLAAALGGACVISQVYSRLVIDCNRDPARADAIVEVADGARVAGNLNLTPQDRRGRVEAVRRVTDR